MENFFKKKLNSGMVVLMEKRDLPVVSLGIANRFGAGFETSEIKGIAHFIEHLLFTGTKTRSHEDISREIEKKGGVLNAFTAHEVTNFWFKLPSEHVFSGLDILTDMLKNPRFDKEKFEKEKKVILEEIKMYHDTPMYDVYDQLEKNMFEKPFGELIIGSKETVSKMDRDFVADYFEKMYNPQNYIVSIVGNVDFEKICDYLEKNFESTGKDMKSLEIQIKNGDSVEERSGIDQAHIVFGIHAPMPLSKEYSVLKVLDAYLANGMSSRLFLKIREEKGLAYSVKSSLSSEKSYSNYLIYVGTTKEAVDEVKKLILEGFDEIEKMTENDLEESKQRIIGLRRVGSEEGINVMKDLLFEELVGDAENYYKEEEKIKQVGLENVKELARKLKKDYSTAVIVPK
jgi:predicted Zn-dependent peptidase